jgi:uncharacterized glyoxalase superfamily protein PhnB
MPRLVPCLRYADAPAAIDWLDRAFGFSRQLVVENADGTIAHAQLALGDDLIMVGSSGNGSPYGALFRSPGGVGGVTAGIYVQVEDADALFARALAAGAEILLPLVDQDYGGRDFTCRDPEGHVWTFGTYDPWA